MTTEAERDCKHGQLARSCNVCELESEVARQAAEIERLKSEAELFAKHTGLTLAAKDALLRQSLRLLREAAPNGYGLGSEQEAVIAAIKQHLGEDHGD